MVSFSIKRKRSWWWWRCSWCGIISWFILAVNKEIPWLHFKIFLNKNSQRSLPPSREGRPTETEGEGKANRKLVLFLELKGNRWSKKSELSFSLTSLVDLKNTFGQRKRGLALLQQFQWSCKYRRPWAKQTNGSRSEGKKGRTWTITWDSFTSLSLSWDVKGL